MPKERRRRMNTAKPLILSLLGWSNSGKTTFIESAIAECARRGITTAAFKKSHNAATLPEDSKDSSRFYKAKADPSIYLSGGDMIILKAAPSRIDKDAIATLCPDASIVFCEGLDVEGSLRVLAAGDESDESALKRTLADIDILIARNVAMLNLAKERNIVHFQLNDVRGFVDYLLKLEESFD